MKKLEDTGYIRTGDRVSLNRIAPTEYDDVFRKCRIHGVVHDENAYLLGGVSAHAGIFSTAEDVCRLGIEYLLCLSRDGLLNRSTAEEMVRNHVEMFGERRGLMWQLNSEMLDSSYRILSHNAFGHSGFTGCFTWIDPELDIVIVVLSNDIYNGRNNRCLAENKKEILKNIVNTFVK